MFNSVFVCKLNSAKLYNGNVKFGVQSCMPKLCPNCETNEIKQFCDLIRENINENVVRLYLL